MLSSAEGGALVAGASAPATGDALRVIVLRAFLWAGEIRQPGEEIEMHWRAAREMQTYGKVAPAPPAPPEEPAP